MRTNVLCALAATAAAAVACIALVPGDRPGDPAAAPVTARVSSTRPVTQPGSVDLVRAAPPLPSNYAVLLDHSLFAAGGRSRAKIERRPAGESPPTRAEASLYLRGVMAQGPAYSALLEEGTAATIRRLAVGDPIARGRVTRITLDGIEYETAGQRRHIPIGHNLDGVAAAPVTQPAAIAKSGAATTESGGKRAKGKRGDPTHADEGTPAAKAALD